MDEEEENRKNNMPSTSKSNNFYESIKLQCGPVFDFYSTDFARIANTEAFVDKTLLIKHIFQGFTIISAPRKFGKTINLDMIKKFLEIEVDENGRPLTTEFDPKKPIKDTTNYRLFRMKDMKITKEKKLMRRHFGKHPVLCVNFSNVAGDSFDDILEGLRLTLHRTFRQYRYLLKSKSISVMEKVNLKRYMGNITYRTLVLADLNSGLSFLSNLLYKHFKKKVFVLIDDYDVPILDLMFKHNPDYMKTFYYIRYLIFGLIKDSLVIKRGVLSARTYISGFLPLYGVDVSQHFVFLEDHVYSQFYGLTLTEVESLLQRFEMEDRLEEVIKWYGGYTAMNQEISVFNYWSVIHFLKYKQIYDYWHENGYLRNFEEILQVPEIRSEMQNLLNENTIKCRRTKNIDETHIVFLKKLINSPKTIEQCHKNLFFQFLYENGCLNPVDITGSLLQLQIPSQEIWNLLNTYFSSLIYYTEKYNFNQKNISTLYSALNSLSADSDSSIFFYFVMSLKSLFSFDCPKLPSSEFEYNSMIYTIVKNKYELLDLNTLIGKTKRLDIAVLREDNVAVLIKMKYQKSSEEALQHLLDQKYYNVLDEKLNNQVNHKILLGLNIDDTHKVTMNYLINSCNFEDAVFVNSI